MKHEMKHLLYLSLGSNIGDREQLLHQAIELIGQRIGVVLRVSAMLETEPVGFVSEHRFMNMALELETMLKPLEALEATQQIERELGRRHKSIAGVYRDRPIDIDLLLYDMLVLETDRLTLPHPRMHERAFVLAPLAEIAPDVMHPRLKQSIAELYKKLET